MRRALNDSLGSCECCLCLYIVFFFPFLYGDISLSLSLSLWGLYSLFIYIYRCTYRVWRCYRYNIQLLYLTLDGIKEPTI